MLRHSSGKKLLRFCNWFYILLPLDLCVDWWCGRGWVSWNSRSRRLTLYFSKLVLAGRSATILFPIISQMHRVEESAASRDEFCQLPLFREFCSSHIPHPPFPEWKVRIPLHLNTNDTCLSGIAIPRNSVNFCAFFVFSSL